MKGSSCWFPYASLILSESACLLTFSFFTGVGPIFLRGGLIWRLHNDRIRSNSQHHASHVYFVCQLSLLFVLLHSPVSDSVLNGGVVKSSTSDQAF